MKTRSAVLILTGVTTMMISGTVKKNGKWVDPFETINATLDKEKYEINTPCD